MTDASERSEEGYLSDEERERWLKSLPEVDSCRNCKFWDPFEDPTWRYSKQQAKEYFREEDGIAFALEIVEYIGHCRRFPPSFIGHDDAGDDVWLQPTTNHRDWCGEHQAVTE